jgi:hypothetical protein
MAWRKAATAAALTHDERLVTARAVPLLLVARIALSTLGFRRARDLLAPSRANPASAGLVDSTATPPPASSAPGKMPIAAIARGVDIAARNQPRPATCLPRALVLHRILTDAGWPSTLHVGVRRTGAGLDGHAWVTVDGLAVGEVAGLTESFVPMRGVVQ